MKKKLILIAAALAMLVATTAVAVAQTEPAGEVGFITNISGDEVLVEEDPQDPVLGGVGTNKGYFTVTGETEILRWQGEGSVPATFEDLEIGQLVVATYAGPILESYPSQGGAGSIVILADPAGEEPVCNIPEGCDFDGDGVPEVLPDVPAGELVPGGGAGAMQYGNAA